MATAAVARPAQALRNRRDPPRPTPPTKRAAIMDSTSNSNSNSNSTGNGNGISTSTSTSVAEPAAKKRRLDEPHVITTEYILQKFTGHRPSLVVHLYDTNWKFEGQEGSNTYQSPLKDFLVHLKKQTVPPDFLEKFHAEGVPFYDGRLIVEVHNHRVAKGSKKARTDLAADVGYKKYSLDNYNPYITPSGLAPYPKKAKEHESLDKSGPSTSADSSQGTEQHGKDSDKDRVGPKVVTMVMHPTSLSIHREIQILANTPLSEFKSSKKSADGTIPPTPQLSVPSTPAGAVAALPGQDQKMCLDRERMYEFEAELLLHTQPPLLLTPASNPQEAENALKLLEHPLHSDPPPSPKTRKRTTAEMAADDAQAAESERRMLIMDERIKPTAPGASDAAGAARALDGFGRFKTIQMVREKHEESERQKKEEEAQAAAQKRQQEEAEKAAREKQLAHEEKQRALKAQRQNVARQQQEQARNQMAQQQALMAQNHGHPQQNNWNQQQGNFSLPASMAQSSPVVRQQTPMMNSSPMLQQTGFGMASTTSQGAGSPPRPTSAAIPNPSVAMARQASQQQGSRNATPQMAQGTPHLAGAVPNRQMSQTPRMAQGSPAPGTPASLNMPNISMQTPQPNGFTQEQYAMLQLQASQQQMQQRGANAGSPRQNMGQPMTADQISAISQAQRVRVQQQVHQMQAAMAQAQAQGDQQLQATLQARQHQMLRQQQQQQQLLAHQQRLLQHQNAGQSGNSHLGSQQTSQMGHGHPHQGGNLGQSQQMTPQQHARQQHQQMQLRQAQQQLSQLHSQYGSWGQIPPQVVQALPPTAQLILRNQTQRQQTVRAQQMATRAQQAQNAGQPVAGSGSGDPEYMATLRNHQAMLAAQQQAQQQALQQGHQMGGMSMAHNMNFNNAMQNGQFGNQGGSGDLSQSFQAMQNALARNQQQNGMS